MALTGYGIGDRGGFFGEFDNSDPTPLAPIMAVVVADPLPVETGDRQRVDLFALPTVANGGENRIAAVSTDDHTLLRERLKFERVDLVAPVTIAEHSLGTKLLVGLMKQENPVGE
jgi:hypothetical protein